MSTRTLAWSALGVWLLVAALAAYIFLSFSQFTGTAKPSTSHTTESTGTIAEGTRVADPGSELSAAGTTASSATSTESTTTTTTIVPLTVAAGGDVIGDRQVGVFLDDEGGEAALAGVRPYLYRAHVAFLNLESPISEIGTRNTTKKYTFRSRPALVDGFVSAGVDVVSLANNHSLDFGPKALADTIARLDRVGIAHAGAGASLEAARAPTRPKTPAGEVAVLAFTDIIPGGFPAGTDRAGVNPASPERDRVLADIREAARQVDYVIVSFHWGTEYTGDATYEQKKLAHQAVDAGADLVLGHHPHVIQGLEIYRDKLIAYSLGDFVFDHYSRLTGEAFVLRVTIPPEGKPSFDVVPIYLSTGYGIPARVTGDAADVILSRLSRLSSELGLTLERDGDRAYFGVLPDSSS